MHTESRRESLIGWGGGGGLACKYFLHIYQLCQMNYLRITLLKIYKEDPTIINLIGDCDKQNY